MDEIRGAIKGYCLNCNKRLRQRGVSIFGCPSCKDTFYLVPIWADDNQSVLVTPLMDCEIEHQMIIDGWIRRAVFYVDNPVE